MPSGIYKHKKGLIPWNKGLKGFGREWNLGKKLSEETKKKIRLARAKQVFSKESIKKRGLSISKANKNRKCPWTTQLNILRTGWKHTLETKRKMSESKKGNKTHLWKGGITPIRDKIRTSLEYKLWRKAVFERDNYTCVWCGKRGGTLNSDHIIRFADILEKLKFEQGIDNLYEKAINYGLLWDVNNGRTLCLECHKKTEGYFNRWFNKIN